MTKPKRRESGREAEEPAAVDGGKQANHETAYWAAVSRAPYIGPRREEPVAAQRQLLIELEQRVYQAVRREPRHIDEIAEETRLPLFRLDGRGTHEVGRG